jgi:hypothetical protein
MGSNMNYVAVSSTVHPHLLIVSRLLSIGTSIVRVRPYYDAAVVISCTQHHFLLNEFGRSDCLSYTYIAEKRLVK